MTTIGRLEATLCAKADKELTQELEAALRPVRQLVLGQSVSVTFPLGVGQAHAIPMLDALQKELFKLLQQKRRNQAVDDFLRGVETALADIEELRNSTS